MKLINELFIKNCTEDTFNGVFSKVWEQTLSEYEKEGFFFLNADYILQVQEETNAYPRILNLLLDEAKRIMDNPEAARYALFLQKSVLNRELYKKNAKLFNFPEQYPLFAFLCLIPSIRNTYRYFEGMGLDADIILSTVRQFEECVFIYERRFDKLGMNNRYFDFLGHYVDCEILNINRLRFEITSLTEPIRVIRNRESGEDIVLFESGDFNSDGLYLDTPPVKEYSFSANLVETESDYFAMRTNSEGKVLRNAEYFPKDKYKTIVRKNDTVLSVHIPVEGELSLEACRESYIRAKEVFSRFFPSLDIKGFVCYSWMMSPELKLYMKPSSRVLGFADQYIRFPIHTEGEDVLNFVFYLKFKSYADLPEDTSLQRALKKLYLDGGRLYEYGGIFAPDRIK